MKKQRHEDPGPNWGVLAFGRHKARTIPQILFREPGYLFWALKDCHRREPWFRTQLEFVTERARRIRIPDRNGVAYVVDYVWDHETGKFVDANFLPAGEPEGHHSIRWPYLDMRVPHELSSSTRRIGGYKNLLQSMKAHWFGSKSYAMTRQRCHAFVEDDDNFVWAEDDLEH